MNCSTCVSLREARNDVTEHACIAYLCIWMATRQNLGALLTYLLGNVADTRDWGRATGLVKLGDRVAHRA